MFAVFVCTYVCSLHWWVTFSGFAEAFYGYYRSTDQQKHFDNWWLGRTGEDC